MTDYNVRLPPDSTGKRSTFIAVVGLNYTGHSPQVMEVGHTVVGATSGAFGEISRVVPDGGDPTVGLIDVKMSVDSPTVVFTDGENIQIDGSTVAQADGTGTPFYTQKVVLAGGTNPFNQASVDEQGAIFTRATEGAPQYDSFGLTRNSEPTILADYTFSYGDLGDWQQSLSGSGAVSYLSDENSIALDVSATSGDIAQVTSNMYHRYQPGFGQSIMMTVACGDAGKANLVRQWGYVEDNDGVFFEMDSSGVINAVLRTSTSGAPVETRVPQTDWNGDTVDGDGDAQNLSRFNLDPTKLNIYWIDFGWLGSGRVRFGVYDNDAARIVCHTFENPGQNTAPFMKTGSLPIRLRVENTGLTSGPSRLKMTCATVMTDGRLIPDRKRRSVKRCYVAPNIGSITTEVAVVSARAAATFSGDTNRKISLPEILSFYVQDQPVLIRLRKGTTLNTPSWTQPAGSSIEIDTAGTLNTNGDELFCLMLSPGTHNIDAPQNFGIQGENLKTQADGSAGDIYTITIESLGTAAQAQIGLTWIDID